MSAFTRGASIAFCAMHDDAFPKMTLRIESNSDGRTSTLRLIGRIEAEHLAELETLVSRHRSQLVLDLGEVTLVDRAFVRFLIACEAGGIELTGSPAYVREWMDSERPTQT